MFNDDKRPHGNKSSNLYTKLSNQITFYSNVVKEILEEFRSISPKFLVETSTITKSSIFDNRLKYQTSTIRTNVSGNRRWMWQRSMVPDVNNDKLKQRPNQLNHILLECFTK